MDHGPQRVSGPKLRLQSHPPAQAPPAAATHCLHRRAGPPVSHFPSFCTREPAQVGTIIDSIPCHSPIRPSWSYPHSRSLPIPPFSQPISPRTSSRTAQSHDDSSANSFTAQPNPPLTTTTTNLPCENSPRAQPVADTLGKVRVLRLVLHPRKGNCPITD